MGHGIRFAKRDSFQSLSPHVMLTIQSTAVIVLTLLSITARAQYAVTADPNQLSELTVTLQLPRNADGPRKLSVRSSNAQIDAPRCGRKSLRTTKDQAWVAPRGCNTVTWIVRPRAVRDGDAIVSDQVSLLFDSRWVLLSDPSSLLRIADGKAPSSLTIQTRSGQPVGFGATPLANQHWRVSSTNNAPEFFIVGDAVPSTRSVGPFDVRYVSDNPSRVERLGLEVLHERALGYLASVLPPPADLPANEHSLLVVWVGVKKAKGQAGGAAGSRSFVANYFFEEPSSDPANAAHSLLILSHEQFHQLADLVRGSLPPLPVWLGESLAHYYGLKALSMAEVGNTINTIRARFIDPARPVAEGLASLARRHAEGDMTVYPMFYSQGASFWAELDESLQGNSTEPRSLDTLIPMLLQSRIEAASALPDEFVAQLRRNLGDRADAIISKYVGI